MTTHPAGNGHLTAEDVAAYLNGAVNSKERRDIERHLAACDVCCDEIVALGHDVPGSQNRWLAPGRIGLAAAAVLAGVLLLGPRAGLFVSDDEPAFRGSQAPLESVLRPSIETVAPAHGSTIARDSVLFIWRPAGDAFYSLTLTDREGALIWRANTRDTLVALDPEVMLRAGDAYYWYVDALLDGGRSPTTGVHRFVAR